MDVIRLSATPLAALLVAGSAAAQPLPDTLRAPADSIISYGWTVDADENRLLVGAGVWPHPGATTRADHKGVVFVYRQGTGGEWELEGRLEPDYVDDEDCFSWTLDLRGDLAAIGAECEQDGAVYLYRYDGAAWVREAKLYPSDVAGTPSPASYFGESVALGDGFLVVGASGSPNPANPESDWGSGAAYVFEHQGGSWVHAATLVNDDTGAFIGEWFGTTVAVTGNEVLVGAPRESPPDSTDRGAVYVFRRTGGSWLQQQKLTAPAPTPYDYFGNLLAAGEERAAVIGSWTAVYPADGREDGWHVGAGLGTNLIPVGVARDGSHVLTADSPYVAPQAHLFVQRGSSWDEVPVPLTLFEQWRDELVSLNSRHAFIGHSGFDDVGYVLIYELAVLTASEPAAPDAPALGLSAAPNPATSESVVRFTLPRAGLVQLTAYDLLGREVALLINREVEAGQHEVVLDTRRLAVGSYLVRLEAEGQVLTRRVTVLR